MNDLKKTFSEKKILLTGHTGFKGTWMLSVLNILGAEVTGYALPPEANCLYQSINGDRLCQSNIGDIRNKEYLDQVIQDCQPDYVFHLAAQALVLPSYEDPLYSFEVNTLGTAYLMESLRKLNKECKAVVITTDKVYRNLETNKAYSEDDKLGGHDPYSGSKAAAELVVDSYIRSFFESQLSHVQVCVARAGNVIGGGDWSDHRIIPDIVSAIHQNNPIVIRNPTSIRPWQHVLDPIFGYLVLAAKMKDTSLPNAFNFGPDPQESVSVLELTKRAVEIWGSGEIEMDNQSNTLHESKQLLLNSSLAMNMLNWHPVLSQMESIDWTIEWYKQVLMDNTPALDAVDKQVEAYFKHFQNK